MESNVSVKNTKNQILDAYNDLLNKLQVHRTEEPKKVQEQKKKEELVSSAKSLSNQGIVKGIAELKVNLSSALDQLGDKFVTEYKNFEELQQAINGFLNSGSFLTTSGFIHVSSAVPPMHE